MSAHVTDRYGPTTGVKELREAVANMYNETYRKNKASKYTHENVCIVPGKIVFVPSRSASDHVKSRRPIWTHSDSCCHWGTWRFCAWYVLILILILE